MGGARHKRRGNDIEREVVRRHLDIGIKAERRPLSGGSYFQGQGHDIDVHYARPIVSPSIAPLPKEAVRELNEQVRQTQRIDSGLRRAQKCP
jgi:hypothetical protein